MSLINKALKKAQRDRAGSTMAQLATPAAETPAYIRGGPAPAAYVAAGVIGAILVGLGVAAAFQLAGRNDPAAGAEPPALATTPAPAAPAARQPEETAEPQPEAARGPEAGLLAIAGPAPAPETAGPAETSGSAGPEASPAVAEPAPATAAAADEQVLNWLATARATGVRLAGLESKVLINGHAYGLNEVVNYQLRLRVLSIQEDKVLFEDGNGTRYLKRL